MKDKIEDKTLVLSLFGLGRIGLPTAVEFAHHGYKVIGVDVNKSLLEELKDSKTFEDESNLEELLKKCNSKNNI